MINKKQNILAHGILKKKIHKMVLNELIKNTITIPDIPNTMNFWHGGNLDAYDDIIAQKNGRYEYGPGLYITTHHSTAQKYSKGSRKLYLITVSKGMDLQNSRLDINKVKEFIELYILANKRKMMLEQLQKYIKNDSIPAHVFGNIILNEKAIKSVNTQYLRIFYVNNGIDYEIIDNQFGWGEKTMVLYNMKKIVKTLVIKHTDIIPQDAYDLKTNWN